VDLYDAAQYFDALDVTDAYTGAYLFTCQMDQYDSTERDSITGWRRTCNAPQIVLPPRRVVRIDGDVFIAGRTVKDYFKNRPIREHLLLHPSDGLFTVGPAKEFLEEQPDMHQMYGALSFRKPFKEEGESSEFFSIYNIYISLTEVVKRDTIVKSPEGVYYRVQNVETQTGYYKTIYAAELETPALLQVTYVPSSGVYDPVTDSSGAGVPIITNAFLERYQTNYRYMTWAADKFRNGDKVLTISQQDVTAPTNNDRVTAGGVDYRVLSVQSDGFGSWELHLRAAEFNLTVGP